MLTLLPFQTWYTRFPIAVRCCCALTSPIVTPPSSLLLWYSWCVALAVLPAYCDSPCHGWWPQTPEAHHDRGKEHRCETPEERRVEERRGKAGQASQKLRGGGAIGAVAANFQPGAPQSGSGQSGWPRTPVTLVSGGKRLQLECIPTGKGRGAGMRSLVLFLSCGHTWVELTAWVCIQRYVFETTPEGIVVLYQYCYV